MLDELRDFIESNPDARELKRAVAVQMFLKGYKHREIGESIGVSSGFISKWTGQYEQLGVSGLRLGYPGSLGYLGPEQRQSVIAILHHFISSFYFHSFVIFICLFLFLIYYLIYFLAR